MHLCREEEEAEYGARMEMNQTAVETLKMFHSQADLDTFLASSQVSTVLYCTVLYCTVLYCRPASGAAEVTSSQR